MSSTDTIFALSTGGLPSGVAIIRISGAQAQAHLIALCGRLPPPRRAVHTALVIEGEIVDHAIVLSFPAPASFTGEDCVELHVHGSRAVVSVLLEWLGSRPGTRQAEAGEFTRRAFLNGIMDLTGVEALSDLIAAETEQQRRQALANQTGQRALYERWRQEIVAVRAQLEALLDFSDQDDVPDAAAAAILGQLAPLISEIDSHVATARRGEIVREGFRIVLGGPPNAGKSSLLNALSRRDAAIVSDIPGTTRDLIEVALDLGGYKVVLVDTAGMRDDADAVEAIGIERARAAAAEADLLLWLSAPDASEPPPETTTRILHVATKTDLGRSAETDCAVSVHAGTGLNTLVATLERIVAESAGQAQSAVPSRARHVAALRACSAALARAMAGGTLAELAAEEMRVASTELGRIVGSVDVEDLLGTIFSTFCIGK